MLFFNFCQGILKLELRFSVIKCNFIEKICCIYLPCSISVSSYHDLGVYRQIICYLKTSYLENCPVLMVARFISLNPRQFRLVSRLVWVTYVKGAVPQWLELIESQAAPAKLVFIPSALGHTDLPKCLHKGVVQGATPTPSNVCGEVVFSKSSTCGNLLCHFSAMLLWQG